ncbi:MAG: rhomboid family intramembrane serine protease [Fidelibacterota bacterium]
MRYYTTEYTRFGGWRLTDAVKAIIAANVAIFLFIFLLQEILGIRGVKSLLYSLFGLVPRYTWSKFRIWQPFTYMFLHGGFWHVAVNMFILWMFGGEIERQWGTREFVKYYVITGAGSGVITVIFSLNSYIPVIGASGAIYGILLAYALMFPNRLIYLYFLFPIKVKYFVIFIGAVAFLSSITAAQSTISNLTHLGGMIIGFMYLKLDWRLDFIKRYFMVRKSKKRLRIIHKREKSLDQMRKEVDRILDKINEVGYENLTEEEKQTLLDASKLLSKKENHKN